MPPRRSDDRRASSNCWVATTATANRSRRNSVSHSCAFRTRCPTRRFEVIPLVSRWGWAEIALWWPDERALIVAEAIGTAPVFALGRRAGVHPMLRLTPPRSQLSDYRPTMLLVGHGPTIESDGAAALDEALAN